VCVAQEDPQHPTVIPHRRLGQTGSGALSNESAEQRRGQFVQPFDADPTEVRLEAIQVMPIRKD
jgi:hypothetical protein